MSKPQNFLKKSQIKPFASVHPLRGVCSVGRGARSTMILRMTRYTLLCVDSFIRPVFFSLHCSIASLFLFFLLFHPCLQLPSACLVVHARLSICCLDVLEKKSKEPPLLLLAKASRKKKKITGSVQLCATTPPSSSASSTKSTQTPGFSFFPNHFGSIVNSISLVYRRYINLSRHRLSNFSLSQAKALFEAVNQHLYYPDSS